MRDHRKEAEQTNLTTVGYDTEARPKDGELFSVSMFLAVVTMAPTVQRAMDEGFAAATDEGLAVALEGACMEPTVTTSDFGAGGAIAEWWRSWRGYPPRMHPWRRR